jgi:hypothetical protein
VKSREIKHQNAEWDRKYGTTHLTSQKKKKKKNLILNTFYATVSIKKCIPLKIYFDMIKTKHRYHPDDIYNSNNWLLRIAIEEQSMVNVKYFNCVTILLLYYDCIKKKCVTLHCIGTIHFDLCLLYRCSVSLHLVEK